VGQTQKADIADLTDCGWAQKVCAFTTDLIFTPMSFERRMEIFPTSSRQSKIGDPNWYTGEVWLDPILAAPAPSRHRSVRAMFDPGARTAWHSHPLGQTVYVIAGIGLIGIRDAPPKILRAGDTIWIPPGQEHWHGAPLNSVLDQIVIHETECGFVTTWMAHVSEEECQMPAG